MILQWAAASSRHLTALQSKLPQLLADSSSIQMLKGDFYLLLEKTRTSENVPASSNGTHAHAMILPALLTASLLWPPGLSQTLYAVPRKLFHTHIPNCPERVGCISLRNGDKITNPQVFTHITSHSFHFKSSSPPRAHQVLTSCCPFRWITQIFALFTHPGVFTSSWSCCGDLQQ